MVIAFLLGTLPEIPRRFAWSVCHDGLPVCAELFSSPTRLERNLMIELYRKKAGMQGQTFAPDYSEFRIQEEKHMRQ